MTSRDPGAATVVASALQNYSNCLDTLLDTLQTNAALPARNILALSLKAYFPGHPEDLQIGRSWVRPLLAHELVPKATKAVRLILGPLAQLVRDRATHALGTGLFLLTDLSFTFYYSAQLLPILSGSEAEAKLLAQLSDESLLQSLAEATKLVGKVAWDMPVLMPAPVGPDGTLLGQGAMTVKTRTARRAVQGAPISSTSVNNTVTWGGRSFGAQLVSHASTVVMAITITQFSASRSVAQDQAVQRVAASLGRTRLMSVLADTLLRAPVLPFVNNVTGALEATTVGFANTLSTLSQSIECMMSYVSAANASAGRPVVQLVSAPEVQRLLLAAVQRVVDLTEAEAEAAKGGGSPASSGARDGAAGGSAAAGSAARDSSPGPAAGWPLFDPAVASQIMPEKALAVGLRRWEVVRSALATWAPGLLRCAADAALPPPGTLAPLLVRLSRALAASPPPVKPPARDTPAAAAATQNTDGLLRVTVLSSGALVRALERGWRPELVVAQMEVWAWGLAALSRRLSGLLADQAGGATAVRAALESSAMPAFGALLRCLDGALQDPAAGWAALSPAAQDDLVRRLAGAALLRTLETALRVTASCGDWRPAQEAALAVAQITDMLALPLLRVGLRLPSPPPGATAAAASPLSLPPPAPPADPWDAPRDLGWLVTATKLVMRRDASSGGGSDGGSAAARAETCRVLRGALQSVGLGPDRLPALRAELSAAAEGSSSDASRSVDAKGYDGAITALMEAEVMCARALGQPERAPAQLPPGVGRLWPPAVLRMCGNPACGNLEGECEAALKLRACGGCKAYRYCGEACQRAHWRDAGHKEECKTLTAASK